MLSATPSSWFTSPLDFKYPPLDPSKKVFRLIRLLTPKPSLIPGCNGTLRVEVFETTADIKSGRACPYDALSYVWGVSSTDKPNRIVLVQVGGTIRKLRIHRPLEVALLNLAAAASTDRLPLFVDQICIDQENDVEKEHQVALMREIYTNCDNAIVWLGPATRNSDLWFDFARERCYDGVLCGLMNHRTASCMKVFDAVMDSSIEVDGQEREDRDAILDMIRLHGDQFPLHGYKDILDRSWFDRLWTIQEACLAPEVIMACGAQTLCCDCIRSGMFFYALYNTYWNSHVSTPQHKEEYKLRFNLFDKATAFGRVFQERKAIHRTGTKQPLYDLILKYNVNDLNRKIGATLGEDRVFGLLGLAAEDDVFRSSVRVRYNRANPQRGLVKTYTEIAGSMLAQNIDTLLFNQSPKKVAGLPSWVPDWSMNLVTPVGYRTLKEPNFSAGGEKQTAEFSLLTDLGRLSIKGVKFDRVTYVGECTYSVAPDSMVQSIHYRDATPFLDEISNFVRDAAVLYNESAASPLDEEAQAVQRLRVCDSGLSYQHFTSLFGLSDGVKRLQSSYNIIHDVGRRLLNSEASVASYSITRIYRTVGIVPWYLDPASEMDALGVWARGPVSAARLAYEGIGDFVYDMTMLCVSSARVKWASWCILLRNRCKKVSLKVDDSQLAKAGLPEKFTADFWESRGERAAFADNVLRNVDRRVYRTGKGYVGMGPSGIRAGDVVAVFHGGTMPHVLRGPGGTEGRDDGHVVWDYVGETYCDGIMQGEALDCGDCRFILA